MKISADDLQIGMYVTVCEGQLLNDCDMFGNQKTMTIKRDRSYQGDLLEIKVVQYPFVILWKHGVWKHDCCQITLNLKEWGLMKLSDEFVKAKKEEIERVKNENNTH